MHSEVNHADNMKLHEINITTQFQCGLMWNYIIKYNMNIGHIKLVTIFSCTWQLT